MPVVVQEVSVEAIPEPSPARAAAAPPEPVAAASLRGLGDEIDRALGARTEREDRLRAH